jgi:hypothetical protein
MAALGAAEESSFAVDRVKGRKGVTPMNFAPSGASGSTQAKWALRFWTDNGSGTANLSRVI